ncbi:MAG: hypothetical protein M3441_00980 [Chloroflexota bacterium]|nr:hypothetical protein [Chloroflexota bacterium]
MYSEALIIGADNHADYLFPDPKLSSHHQRALSTLLAFPNADALARLEIAHRREVDHNNLEEHRITENARDTKERIAAVERQLRDVDVRLAAMDTDESVFIDPQYLARVRSQIATVSEHVTELANAQYALLDEERRVKEELNKSRRTVRQLTESIKFRLFLTDYVVERCPHCEQAIQDVSADVELASGHCHVCHTKLRDAGPFDDTQHRLEEAKAAESKSSAELKRVGANLKDVRAKLDTATQQRESLVREFEDIPRQERAGFTGEMRDLLTRRGSLQAQLEYLRERTKESQKAYLAELQNRKDILGYALSHLRAEVTRHKRQVLDLLEGLTLDLARGFGVPNLEAVALSDALELSLIQSGKKTQFTSMGQSEQIRIKIAFHLALLTLRVEHEVGKHPGFLIVDAPGSGELDEARLGAVMRGFESVRDTLGEKVQILVGTTEQELAEVCAGESLDRRDRGEKFF